MSVSHFEAQIAPKLKWRKIEDAPNLPLSSFEDIRRRVQANQFSIGIDFTTSNELAQRLYGGVHMVFALVLSAVPFITAIISLALTFVLGNYWLLLGIVLSFAGQVLSNPYNPSKKFWEGFVGLLLFFVVYSLWQGKDTMTYLSAFFGIPFFTNSWLYEMNQIRLKAVAMNSEKIFIFLYQIGKLGLKDNSNQKMYWYTET